MSAEAEMIDKVRRALGRNTPVTTVPIPPVIDEKIARLVRRDADLVKEFEKRSADLHMDVMRVAPDQLSTQLLAFLKSTPIRKIALADAPILKRFGLKDTLQSAGYEVKSWDEITLDELYDGYDCGITDVQYAVAETGGLIVRPSAQHGRALSLVPMFHIAIVEPHQFLADMIDLMSQLAADPHRSNSIMITGPSKTADIEMNVVTGVHGPNVVKAFILQ